MKRIFISISILCFMASFALPEGGRLVPVDIAPFCNMGFVDEKAGDGVGGWIDDGPTHDLRFLPVGEQKFAGIYFKIIDPAKNNGKSTIVIGGRTIKRPAVEGIGVELENVTNLYFLHAAAWPKRGEMGYYLIHYADGSTVRIPLVNMDNIADWYQVRTKLTNAFLAWGHFLDADKVFVGLYLYKWPNPYPDKKITAFDFVSTTNSVLLLVALTAEVGDAGVELAPFDSGKEHPVKLRVLYEGEGMGGVRIVAFDGPDLVDSGVSGADGTLTLKLHEGLYRIAACKDNLLAESGMVVKGEVGKDIILRQAAPNRYSLGLYHFNVQYICGDEEIEDRVIVESFEPLVDMFLRHPEWGADFEMQGNMIEIMAERHPRVLEKFKKLLDRGRVRLVSFHYSDQLFLAYPAHDMEWSIRINDEILMRHGIKRSNIMFAQEDQFGEGVAEFMKQYGYNLAALSSSYYLYFHHDDVPLWATIAGVPVFFTREYSDSKIDVNWHYFGDGEFVASTSPYSADYRFVEEKLRNYEGRLMYFEATGRKIVSIAELARDMKKLGYKPSKCPPILDGFWGGDGCKMAFRWMGDYKAPHEQDVELRSLTFRSRRELLAAETLLKHVEERGLDVEAEKELLKKAWAAQLLAEVTDSTGWGPRPIEVEYSINYAQQAMEVAKELIETLKEKIGLEDELVKINTFTGSVVPVEGEEIIVEEEVVPVYPVIVAGASQSEVHFYKRSDSEYRVEVIFTPSEKRCEVSFPLKWDNIAYSPALAEGKLVVYPLDLFDFDDIYLGLSNGLIGLDEKVYLIKDNHINHLACQVDKTRSLVTFAMNKPPKHEFKWQFYLIFGDAETALDKANTINTYPVVIR